LKYNIFFIGPSGSGKSTLGNYFAKKQNFVFVECDEFHSKENILKMKKGVSINKIERLKWVKRIKKKLIRNSKINLIISFSGLVKVHRKMLIDKNKINFFIFLKTTNKILKKRLDKRKGHFFNPILLSNQIKSFQISKDLIVLDSNKSVFYNYKKINRFIKFD